MIAFKSCLLFILLLLLRIPLGLATEFDEAVVLSGAAYINPAQIDQLKDPTIELHVAQATGDVKWSRSKGNRKETYIGILPYYVSSPYILGLRIDSFKSETEFNEGVQPDRTSDVTILTPHFAYKLSSSTTVALAIAMIKSKESIEFVSGDAQLSANRISLGIARDDGNTSYGFSIRSEAKDKDTIGNFFLVGSAVLYLPMQFVAHGRYGISSEIGVLGAITYSAYSDPDPDDAWEDNADMNDKLSLMAGMQWLLSSNLRLDFIAERLGAGDYNKHKSSGGTQATAFEIDVAHRLSSSASFGGLLRTVTGDHHYTDNVGNDYKYSRSDTRFGLFGGYYF